VDAATGEITQHALPAGAPESARHDSLFLVHGGRELWLFDCSTRILRFEMPTRD
jgi:hypothetical protein